LPVCHSARRPLSNRKRRRSCRESSALLQQLRTNNLNQIEVSVRWYHAGITLTLRTGCKIVFGQFPLVVRLRSKPAIVYKLRESRSDVPFVSRVLLLEKSNKQVSCRKQGENQPQQRPDRRGDRRCAPSHAGEQMKRFAKVGKDDPRDEPCTAELHERKDPSSEP
jgi:hypothetical protein